MSNRDGLNIMIAHGSDDVRGLLVESLDKRHEVVGHCGTVSELKQLVSDRRPELIVTGIVFPDGDGIDAVIEIGAEDPLPAVIVTNRRSVELVHRAMRDHVMAYLIEPVRPEDLEAAIIVASSRYEQLEELAGQVSDLREALAHRKVIERAKGILMAGREMTEADAFMHLRDRSQRERRPMVDVAQELVDLETK